MVIFPHTTTPACPSPTCHLSGISLSGWLSGREVNTFPPRAQALVSFLPLWQHGVSPCPSLLLLHLFLPLPATKQTISFSSCKALFSLSVSEGKRAHDLFFTLLTSPWAGTCGIGGVVGGSLDAAPPPPASSCLLFFPILLFFLPFCPDGSPCDIYSSLRHMPAMPCCHLPGIYIRGWFLSLALASLHPFSHAQAAVSKRHFPCPPGTPTSMFCHMHALLHGMLPPPSPLGGAHGRGCLPAWDMRQ